MVGLLAVDVGNRRMKFGWFGRCWAEPQTRSRLPEPDSVFCLEQQDDWNRLERWLEAVVAGAHFSGAEVPSGLGESQPTLPLEEPPACVPAADTQWACWIGSVNRPAAGRLLEWLRARWPQAIVKLLQWSDLPLQVRVQKPERVGVDRLLNAVAANRIRTPDQPAVVVDAGTAITVDWISSDGSFCGGAIMPGLEMASKALHLFTDLLPEVSLMEAPLPPPVLGTYTEAAIRSGLYWGTLGAIRELLRQLTYQATGEPQQPPRSGGWPNVGDRLASPGALQVFLTGGAGQLLACQLGPEVQYLPHLTLAGIALSALLSPTSF
ncbi:MAG: type III pantothenate kinase [Thermoguttaceae bacterium]|nr:type III pantothenate kinase [Thermoguttaceae bacterium]MDW8039399.1 type III pantothenate kinase [Thermoguttaceae bacterium]